MAATVPPFQLRTDRKDKNNCRDSKIVGMTELVDKSLTSLRLLHDSFLIILTQGSGKFVIVHRWAVLRGRFIRIFHLKKNA